MVINFASCRRWQGLCSIWRGIYMRCNMLVMDSRWHTTYDVGCAWSVCGIHWHDDYHVWAKKYIIVVNVSTNRLLHSMETSFETSQI